MRFRPVLRLACIPLLVLALALAAGWWASGRTDDGRGSLTSALDTLPSDTQAAGFTDWTTIRRHVGPDSVASAAGREALASAASQRDLSTRSVLADVMEEMHDSYGWSAADLEWEAYGQAPTGAAMVGRLRSVPFDAVRAALRKLGYTHAGDVWQIDPDSPKAPGPELSSTLGAVALVPGRHLVVAASTAAYAGEVLDVIRGDAPSLLDVRAAADVASRLVGVDAAYVLEGRLACRSTGFADVQADVLAQARAVVSRAGGLERPTYAARGIEDGTRAKQVMRFALGFDSPSDAADQLRTRVPLSAGPFIGRTGRIEDSLDLTDAAVDGSTVSLVFDHDPDTTVYMTGQGPLLFAGCTP